MTTEQLAFHAESQARIPAPAQRVFAYLDDHRRLAAHMSQRSWRMGWGRMDLRLDEREGHAVGSHIQLEGRVFGVRLALDEVITEYDPRARKVWATVGTPRLLVIGAYRMGFALAAAPAATGAVAADDQTLTVFIDYALPERGLSRFLGRLFGHSYARWCTRRMVEEARGAFAPAPAATATGAARRVAGV